MREPKKKTFMARVVLNGKNVPDFGFGKGVVREQEITFTDERGRGWDSPLFAVSMMEHENRMIKDVCRVEWSEVKNRKRRQR